MLKNYLLRMRHYSYLLVSLGVLLASSISSNVALAEEAVKSQITQVTVTGVRCVIPQRFCVDGAKQSQTLILKSAQSRSDNLSKKSDKPKEVKEFRVISTDLQRKDQAAIVPARWMQSQFDSKVQLAPQKLLSLPMQFDLDTASQSGEYSGTLFIEHSEGDLSVPVTLKLKDSWHFALPLLVGGVVLGLLLSAYQVEGFDRDDITVKMEQLRSQMRLEVEGKKDAQAETAKVFQAKAESYFVDIKTAMDAKNWIDARKSFLEAQAVWSRLCKQPEAWVDLYEYVDTGLGLYLGKEIPNTATYGKDLKAELKRIKREMADCETSQQFSDKLKPLREKVQQFLAAGKLNARLNTLRIQMGATGEQWSSDIIDLEDRLSSLSLNDLVSLQNWQESANQIKQKMEESQPVDSSSRGETETVSPSMESVPQARTLPKPPDEQQAAWRLQVYRWTGHGVAIVLLGWVGFNQLYASNATFGANAVADYSSLLAWGFTAEVTRDSVGKVLQKFKVPGIG
jgi:hypothetical protein